MKIGITGQTGFVGTHLFNHLGLCAEIERIPFEDSFFGDDLKLRSFVKKCDVIVHFAAMNRHQDQQVIYDTNIALCQKLIDAMEYEKVYPHVLFSSSTQEILDNLYGKSKLEGRLLLESWAKRTGASFTGLVVPNVFGEFAQPYYNTFIATFAQRLTHREVPEIQVDSKVKLIYVASLCQFIIKQFSNQGIQRVEVPFDFEKKVSEILSLFESFKCQYFEGGIIPKLSDIHEVNLLNTFRSYIEPRLIQLIKHEDERGMFVETLKLSSGGQISFSTTQPNIVRGNHYHTRKIERFTVIKGKALIQLRRVGAKQIYEFYLDGSQPSYVDIPIWFTHNIKNIGEDELYTQFWINEWYNPTDSDTYFEKV